MGQPPPLPVGCSSSSSGFSSFRDSLWPGASEAWLRVEVEASTYFLLAAATEEEEAAPALVEAATTEAGEGVRGPSYS